MTLRHGARRSHESAFPSASLNELETFGPAGALSQPMSLSTGPRWAPAPDGVDPTRRPSPEDAPCTLVPWLGFLIVVVSASMQ